MSLVLDGIDWAGGELRHAVSAMAVDPINHGVVLGDLPLTADAGKYTEEYYSSTRVSADLSIADWATYPAGAWVRLYHSVEGTGYSALLMTGFVWDESASVDETGTLAASPQVVSALKAIDVEQLEAPLTLAQGVSVGSAIGVVLSMANPSRPWALGPRVHDTRLQTAKTIDAGTSRLSAVSDLCNTAGDRLDVRPDGAILVDGYVAPSRKEPRCALDSADLGGVVLASQMSISSDSHQTVSRAIVARRKSETDADGKSVESVTTAYADVPGNYPSAPGRRGYAVTEYDEIDDSDGVTDLKAEAYRRLAASDAPTVDWEVETMWVPLHAGDVVVFSPPGMASRKCLVKKVEYDLGTFVCLLTLREV